MKSEDQGKQRRTALMLRAVQDQLDSPDTPEVTALLVFATVWRRHLEARPQLHVKNTGTTAVLLRLGKERVVDQPGEDWGFRFAPGDSLEIFAGTTESGQSKRVTLQGEPYQKVQAEVSTDKNGQITFQLVGQK